MKYYRLIHSLKQYVTVAKPEHVIIESYRAGDAVASDFDEIIDCFDTVGSALAALAKHSTDIYRRGDVVYVDEYGVEEVEYEIDDDGDESEYAWELVAASRLPETVSGSWHYILRNGQYEEYPEVSDD